ncbi:MAG TPA: two-component regulator propeller domain-containing protein, partial [Chitinophagaceae bacterium]|nr:two-component regulator propeller domain-containing protein [Chitinophagaceae bacterium]
MRFTCVTLLYCLPLLALAQQAAPQENTYFNIPPALQAAGVKWVNDICKDHRGLTWLATNNGIFRFDGTNVLYARTRIDDSATLPSNTVTSVTEDHEGNIWVGTAQGGAIINPNTLACSRIKDSTGYTPAVKFKFLVDADGNIWGETDAGLYKYNRQKKYLQLVFSSGIQGYYGSAAVISAAEWNKDELVLATLADVVFFDKHSFSFHRIFVDPQRSRTDLSKIYVDGDG